MDFESRKDLAIKIAKMYYVNEKSQEEIAESTGMSRSNISRILKKCVQDGVVEIIVHDTISVQTRLANSIQVAFGLKQVIIVQSESSIDRIFRNVGNSLGIYLMQILKDGMTIGVGSGRASYYTGRSINNKKNIKVDVVQLQGAVNSTISMDEGSGLIFSLASKLNGKGYILNAPLMVRSKNTCRELQENELVRKTMKKYHALDVAIFEIESPKLYESRNSQLSFLSKADILQLAEVGVAAGVCGRYYKIDGKFCSAGVHDRVISIQPQILKNVSYKIGVSVGKYALDATLSILKAGIVNVLVIDEKLANLIEYKLPNSTT